MKNKTLYRVSVVTVVLCVGAFLWNIGSMIAMIRTGREVLASMCLVVAIFAGFMGVSLAVTIHDARKWMDR